MALGCLLYSTSETDTYDIGIKITKCYTTCPQFGWNLPAVGKKLSRIWWFSEDLLVLWVLTHANHRGERLWISWVFENWIFEGLKVSIMFHGYLKTVILHFSLYTCTYPVNRITFCRVDAFAYSSQLYKNWLLVSTTWKKQMSHHTK